MPGNQIGTDESGARQLGEILQRIDERLHDLKMSQRRAALRAGLSPAQIRTMRRQYKEGTQHGASVRTIRGLAEALGTTPEWLESGVGTKESVSGGLGLDRSGKSLRLAGVVAAGVWNESAGDRDQPRRVPVPPDPRYPADYQSAYEVRGTSMDRVAHPGDFLIVVDRDKTGMPVRSGDLVIMTRFKEGGLQEVTARRYKVEAIADTWLHQFRFESNDPRFGDLLTTVTPKDGNPSVQDNESFRCGGVVVAIYRPL